MALRNIINSIQTSKRNLQQAAELTEMNAAKTTSVERIYASQSESLENANSAATFYRLIQPAESQQCLRQPVENIYQHHRSRSANNLPQSSQSSTASSVQIRTSSPISTSSSSSSGPANSIISPSKFLNAVHSSRSSMRRPKAAAPGGNYQMMHNPYSLTSLGSLPPQYASIKELAFEKLRRHDSAKAIEEIALASDDQQLLRSAGKLQIAAYNNAGLLTLHVIQGQHFRKLNNASDGKTLLCERIASCDSYVTVTTLPAANDRVKCSTSVYKDSKAPFYDDKFSFEFDPLSDYNNRLVVSVWKKNKRQNIAQLPTRKPNAHELLCAFDLADELIGCFSFKIKHLMTKGPITPDWFHLLPFQHGIQKHLRCNKSEERGPAESDANNKITGLNKDLKGLANLSLIIERNPNVDGFGFTVSGSCPCKVSKVDNEKPAFAGGLRQGDFISKINGVNVSRATCETVVKLIMKSKQRLCMDVCREKQHSQKLRPSRPSNYLNPIMYQNPAMLIMDPRQAGKWSHPDPNSSSSTASSSEMVCMNPAFIDERQALRQVNNAAQCYEFVAQSKHMLLKTSSNNSNQTSSSQSSSGVSSAYENIDRYEDYENYEQLQPMHRAAAEQTNISIPERARTSNQSTIYAGLGNTSDHLPQIKLNNYQSQPQLFYGLESVPEEDENCTEMRSKMSAAQASAGDSEDNEEGDELNLVIQDDDEAEQDEFELAPPVGLTTTSSSNHSAAAAAFCLAESGIRYVDATTDEDDEQTSPGDAEQMRRVSMQYYGRCGNMTAWRQLRYQP